MQIVCNDKALTGNGLRVFDGEQEHKLGRYVYALRDPRDNKVFYVGQGGRVRLFDHFNQADRCLAGGEAPTSKLFRIIDIWTDGLDVDWFIVAHGLAQAEADRVEAAAIDILGRSQNGKPLNEIKGPHSTALDQDELLALLARPVNPPAAMTVFVFPIHNALKEGKTAYDATRIAWAVREEYRDTGRYNRAVGLSGGVARGGYTIEKWDPASDTTWEFSGSEDTALSASGNWTRVLNAAQGYWQRGNYLIAEFDGRGRFRIIRGASDHDWRNCVEPEGAL